MTASSGALEHSQGFLEVFNGAGNYDAGRLLESWAAPFDIVDPGVAFKRHPCCASTHPAVDALLSLKAQHGLWRDRRTHAIAPSHNGLANMVNSIAVYVLDHGYH